MTRCAHRRSTPISRTHCGWTCSRSPALAVLLLALSCRSAAAAGPTAECPGGVWPQAPNDQLEAGRALPQVQCWRNPPCARATFATTDECAKRKSLADWHTLLGPDPHFPNGVSQYREFGDMLVQELVNQTVVVVGDSISSLIFQAALCEAAKSSSVVDAMDPRVAAAGVGAVERFRKGMHGITQQARSSGNGASPWVGGGPHALTVVLETGTLFVRKGWHRWGRGDMEAVLSLADVVLVNYGLHYVGNLTEFEEDAPQMLAQLDAWAAGRPGRRVLWRETAEEHTNVETHQPGSGYLDTEVGHPDGNKTTGCQCAAERPPDRPSQPAVLNAIIGKLLPQFPHIAFVPFYNLTKPRYNMHEAAFCSFEGLSQSPGHPSFCCDCVHFCYTPELWRAFFSGMFDALQSVKLSPQDASLAPKTTTAAV